MRFLSISLLMLLAFSACQTAPDRREEAEAAVRAAAAKWSAAGEAKNSAEFVRFYAENAEVLLEGAPDPRGSVAVSAAISGMMNDPRFSLSFHADQVVASRSGDLVYEVGTYAMTFSGEGGKTMRQTGRYVDVWRKQADGSWKVVLDAPVSDATNPM